MRRIVSVALLLFACGCGSSTPSAPTTPPATAPTITTANTMVYVGQVVQFAATGTSPITWGGDQPSVANVDVPTGRVTGVGIGRVTIWADNAGGHTTRLLRVLPSYAGTWAGNYVINGCQSTGGFTTGGFCNTLPVGAVLNMNMAMNQTDDKVTSGTFALGSLQGTLNPTTVDESGLLPLTGSISSPPSTVNLSNARFQSPQAGTMTGTFDATFSQTNLSGFGLLSCTLRVMTRTGGGPTVAALFVQPQQQGLALEQVLQLMRR